MQPLPDNALNIPAFLSKLWKMVNDPDTDKLICWSQTGTSFIIQNQAAFWYKLLPLHYKHNNMSSFVRQLNMYGFHKISTVENGALETDKDELQFFHQYFRKDKPDQMRLIKRKVTGTSKMQSVAVETPSSIVRTNDITKVLTEVKQLRGRQSDVDSQLTSMKKENTILWRELAMLRQKHHKQQQIVNKLIQFLVTIVQPQTRMSGLGVKRQYPLMINECPKRVRTDSETATTSDGPVIHELEEVYEPLLIECEQEQEALNSPETQLQDDQSTNDVDINLVSDILQEDSDDAMLASSEGMSDKVFLNPTTQDTLLSNLMNGSYNSNTLREMKMENASAQSNTGDGASEDFTVATREPQHPPKLNRLASVKNSREDFDIVVGNMASELDQLKDILNGCTSFDANTLLGLFNDESPPYGLSVTEKDANDVSKNNVSVSDPLVSGSELATYGSNIDFSQLFNESNEERSNTDAVATNIDLDGSITTPKDLRCEPLFPTGNSKK